MGILHRDLKPSNILIDSLDQPHITDFGLAKDLKSDGELTLTGQTLGSPNYIPPEQIDGRSGKPGPPSDIYSLGAILYHLLTGRPPFVGESLTATLQQGADTEITTFPDGSVRYGNASLYPTEVGFQDRLRDFNVVLECLTQSNSNDPAFAGRLDLNTLGAMGFSWGGGVAAEFARLNNYVKAVVLLDSYLENASDLIHFGLSKPFIGMYSTELGGDTTLYEHSAARTAVWFLLKSSLHAHFSDYRWEYVPGDMAGGREISRTLNDWALWFLDKHVKELDAPMPALKDYSRITGFKQK
jgi:pimeloyl-ACP methyl ester carboxylesterase